MSSQPTDLSLKAYVQAALDAHGLGPDRAGYDTLSAEEAVAALCDGRAAFIHRGSYHHQLVASVVGEAHWERRSLRDSFARLLAERAFSIAVLQETLDLIIPLNEPATKQIEAAQAFLSARQCSTTIDRLAECRLLAYARPETEVA